MKQKIRIAVVGAGLIGKRHLAAISVSEEAEVACVIDPTEAGRAYAQENGFQYYNSIAAMVAAGGTDGVILATPNQVHVENGLECVAAGLPTLVEKPLASDVASAQTLVDAALAADVPLLTGHHRRHNPLIQAAKARIDAGDLGTVTAIHGQCWFFKPDDYFDVAWRRAKGAGPVFVNLIHDIDLLRYLCGDVVSVQAMESNAVRGNAVEETAVILLRFENGALGTVNVSDTVVAPWSWEMTARENPAYPAVDQSCYTVGGTHGSLSLPDLTFWHHPERRSWWAPISATRSPRSYDDPLACQIAQFAAVIRGEESPLVSGAEGLATLKVVEAVKRAAETGTVITDL
ncbi:MAG TPA: Gfo/Idh/MocA family oxidoreductase [Paracoccaceae bacterium]|nr:Gfo/Idh/MocA family oxidoreductase [Paracoccaceae bacterium]